MADLKRRGTLAEEAAQSLIDETTFTKNGKKKKTVKDSLKNLGRQLYNSEYREFLGRDSKAWFKLFFFYTLFYTFLSGFFVILVLIFYAVTDLKEPTYYNENSVMNSRQKVNPGLGFRPQPDPESELISYNPNDYKKMYNSLDLFLKEYQDNKDRNFTGAHGKKIEFDIDTIISNTSCSKENFYGYNTPNPCVVIKLNKIFGWLPKLGNNPLNSTKAEGEEKKYFVFMACVGETSVDKDNIGQIEYYSAYPARDIGGIDFKYFPYRNQPGYLSPLVFVHFKTLPSNTLVNVECRAYAKNIDNKDKINRRGMTKFQLFVSGSK